MAANSNNVKVAFINSIISSYTTRNVLEIFINNKVDIIYFL